MAHDGGMSTSPGGFLRRNAFVLASVALPAIVVLFFLLASAIPRWTVPAPTYDLVLRAQRPYLNRSTTAIAVDIVARDRRVEVRAQPFDGKGYEQGWALFRFEHATGRIREIPIDLPSMAPGDAPRIVVVDALAGLQLSNDAVAPDGYQLESRTRRGSGLVGDVFGMGRRTRSSVTLVNRGRVVRADLPSIFEDYYRPSVQPVGWVLDPGVGR